MIRLTIPLTLLIVFSICLHGFSAELFVLKNDRLEIAVSENAEIIRLTNLETGWNYASGKRVWRLYYDTKKEKEFQVRAMENTPKASATDTAIEFAYDGLKCRDKTLKMRLSLRIVLEDDLVRFYSKVENDEPGTIIRELQYPLLGDCRLPEGTRLLHGRNGGQMVPDPKAAVRAGNAHYMAPSQHYRQADLTYPIGVSTNCYTFTGKEQGLYFGSHDPTFQDTCHGLRMYPNEKGHFELLEAGLYKYPNIVAGQRWECNANVIAPYTGTWHRASNLYRRWVDTWWDRQPTPKWVMEMKSWQRVIFRHQYGETFFRYTDLPGRMAEVGDSVGAEAVLAFGWWEKGMDHGNPDYLTDPEQGGDEAWKKAIAAFRKGKDGRRLLLYFNGKLIDKESDYYKSGEGREVCYRDNTGTEYTEQYRFKGMGTFTGDYNKRTFVVADCRNPKWQAKLFAMADQAYEFGADSVFYDQLGYAERVPNWDLSGEFPIPNLYTIADKAAVLKLIREHIAKKGNPDFALGTEWFTDVTAQHVDYIHNITGGTWGSAFLDWIRYTFPEVPLSDREIRDDTDIERRVNHGLLRGLRNDIEIFRCRDLIDKTPNYRRYLAQANALKEKHKDLLLAGTYRDTEGFSLDNPKVEARCFSNGNRLAVALTQSRFDSEMTTVTVPNNRLTESSVLGPATVEGLSVTIKRNGLAVLIFEKN